MSIIDLLVVIIAVTILVTIALGSVTYMAYKLRRARRSVPEEAPRDGSWYFIRYLPDTRSDETT